MNIFFNTDYQVEIGFAVSEIFRNKSFGAKIYYVPAPKFVVGPWPDWLPGLYYYS